MSLSSLLSNLFRRTKPVDRTSKDNDRLTEWEFKEMVNGRCPDCGGKTLCAGPEGGCSQNIACAACYSEFTVSPFGGERNGDKGSCDPVRMRMAFGITATPAGIANRLAS